jgi:hypothetical protein
VSCHRNDRRIAADVTTAAGRICAVRRAGETAERLFGPATRWEVPSFTGADRAAPPLTESGGDLGERAVLLAAAIRK